MIWDDWRRDPDAALGGDVYALTIITAIRRGCEAELCDHLASLDPEASPFRRLAGTHFARLVVLDTLAGRSGDPHQRLLFSAVIDGCSKADRDAFLTQMCTRMPEHVDAIWGRCRNPGRGLSQVPETFAQWMAGHQVRTQAFYFMDAAPVPRIKQALRVHPQVRRFALRTQYLTPQALRDEVSARSKVWRA